MQGKGYLIEVSIRKNRELLLNRLQKSNCDINTVIGSMSLLSLQPHGSKWPTSLGTLVVCTSRVPSVTKTEYINIKKLFTTKHNPTATEFIYIYARNKRPLRKSKHQWSAVLLSNKASKLPFGFVNSLQILRTHGWVALSHGKVLKHMQTINFTFLQFLTKRSIHTYNHTPDHPKLTAHFTI